MVRKIKMACSWFRRAYAISFCMSKMFGRASGLLVFSLFQLRRSFFGVCKLFNRLTVWRNSRRVVGDIDGSFRC